MTDDTFFSRAQAEADLEAQGRFKREVSAEIISKKPLIKYPDQPEGSPFHSDPVPDEPPLNYSIDAQEVIGGPAVEVAAAPADDGGLARQPFVKRRV
jgi:hypothetical protein